MGCAFKPSDLELMMRAHAGHQHNAHAADGSAKYNELVIDTGPYLANLPQSVEAIVGEPSVHAAFLRRYGLTRTQVPLLKFSAGDAEFQDY